MRIPQPAGLKGSLKWIQKAVNERPEVLDAPLLRHLPGAARITWRSPLAADDHAEYRDGAFLERLGAADLTDALAAFWPSRGPQWDALATTDAGDLLLVEAKAHVREMFSACQARPASLARIQAALSETARAVGAEPDPSWVRWFYQYANRLAHLHVLRSHGRPAWLVLVSFLGDAEVGGPITAETWRAAYTVMDKVLGLEGRHPLSRYILHIYPSVRDLN